MTKHIIETLKQIITKAKTSAPLLNSIVQAAKPNH